MIESEKTVLQTEPQAGRAGKQPALAQEAIDVDFEPSMATSLIDELQLDASNSAVSVSTLLRKALMVAAKLELSDIPEWINKELSGYSVDKSLPPYRIVHGEVKARTLRGWVPVQFPTNDMQGNISKKLICSFVAEIEALSKKDGKLAMGFPPEAQQLLQQWTHFDAEFVCFFPQARLNGILDEIRNQVLRWAIALDKAGVRGDGLSFTGPEKEKAHSMTFHVDTENFTIGVAGGTGGQANVASGDHAHLNIHSIDNSINPITYKADDMTKLAEEFSKLRSALVVQARDAEHFAAIGAVASAEIAAKDGKPSNIAKALSALGTSGKWALGIAREIGVHLAASALKPYLGLPPG